MRLCHSITALAASGLAWADDTCPGGDLDLTVRTSSGTFRGFVDPKVSNVNQWLGIPFGAPPVAEKRFMPPEPANYSGAHDATTYKPICFQQSTLGQGVFWELVPEFQNTDPQSEDCLYLNVWGPRKPVDSALATARKVPVIIWGVFFLSALMMDAHGLRGDSLWRWISRGRWPRPVSGTRSMGPAYANAYCCDVQVSCH
jgi:hypothetical protein